MLRPLDSYISTHPITSVEGGRWAPSFIPTITISECLDQPFPNLDINIILTVSLFSLTRPLSKNILAMYVYAFSSESQPKFKSTVNYPFSRFTYAYDGTVVRLHSQIHFGAVSVLTVLHVSMGESLVEIDEGKYSY